MPRISPFTGTRLRSGCRRSARGGDGAALRRDRRGGAAGVPVVGPYSVVHLDLSEDDRASATATSAPRALLSGGARTARSSRAPRRVTTPTRCASGSMPGSDRIRGLFCALELEDWGGRVILPHERTMPGPVEDRLRLLRRPGGEPVRRLRHGGGAVRGRSRPSSTRVCAGPPATSWPTTRGWSTAMWPVDARSRDRRLARRRAAADRRRPPSLHDGAAVPGRAPRRRRPGAVGRGPRARRGRRDRGAPGPAVPPAWSLEGAAPRRARGSATCRRSLAELDDDSRDGGVVPARPAGWCTCVADLQGEPPTVSALHEQVLGIEADGGAIRFTPDAADAEAAVRGGEAARRVPAAADDDGSDPGRDRSAVSGCRRSPPSSGPSRARAW